MIRKKIKKPRTTSLYFHTKVLNFNQLTNSSITLNFTHEQSEYIIQKRNFFFFSKEKKNIFYFILNNLMDIDYNNKKMKLI